MKKVSAIVSISLLILCLGAGTSMVKADSNNSILFPGNVTLYSPLNQTYDSNYLTLNLTAQCAGGIDTTLVYSIDGSAPQGPIPLVYASSEFPFYYAASTVQLPKLSAGSHNLTITEQSVLADYHGANPPGAPFKQESPSSSNWVATWVDTVNFSISSGWTPQPSSTVTILSVENQTYNSTDIPLTFTVDQNLSKAAYCLDDKCNVTINGNSTLTGLTAGTHEVTVYAWNDDGAVGASGTFDFTVANLSSEVHQASQPEHLELAIVALVLILSVAIAGFLLYLKTHRKPRPSP